jgi:hypothetical protein
MLLVLENSGVISLLTAAARRAGRYGHREAGIGARETPDPVTLLAMTYLHLPRPGRIWPGIREADEGSLGRHKLEACMDVRDAGLKTGKEIRLTSDAACAG